MSKLETVQALITKAGREDTPIEEARGSALQAARLIVKLGFMIVDPKGSRDGEVPFPDDLGIPDFNLNDFEEVALFSTKVARHPMTCIRCKKVIAKGMDYAHGDSELGITVTHIGCRSYFSEGKK